VKAVSTADETSHHIGRIAMRESEDTDIIPTPTSIMPAPSAITPVNSSLAKTVIPSESQLKNVTFWKLDLDTILDGLIPDPLPESSGKDNAIHHLNIIVFGKPNTGKTTLVESIAEALARRYGKNNVKALRSTRDLPLLFESIDKLFGRFKKPPKAILLFADDMTKALKKLSGTVDVTGSSGKAEKMRRVDYWLDKWYDIRGELFRHGMRQGLVVMVAGLHRFYGGDIDLRADADLLLVRSTGTPGTFDANRVEKMLGPVVYYAMRQHEVDALRDRRELSWTAFVAKTGSGVFRVPRPSMSQSWLMRNVGPSTTTDEIDSDPDEPVEQPTIRPITVPAKKSITGEKHATPEKPTVKERPAPREKIVTRTSHKEHKWVRRISRGLIATGVLAILYLAYAYLWPLIR
jgi:ATPase family associated with various cellular activities (AAA)